MPKTSPVIDLRKTAQRQSRKTKKVDSGTIFGDTFHQEKSQFRITRIARDNINASTLGKSGVIFTLLMLVFYLLPGQQPTEAKPEPISTTEQFIAVIPEDNAQAGEPIELQSTAVTPGILVTTTINRPDHQETTISEHADEDGFARSIIPGSDTKIAGTYIVRATAEDFISRDTTFQVIPGPVSTENSRVTTNQSLAPADGQSEIAIQITIRDQFQNAIPDRDIQIISSRNSDLISQEQSQTDHNGELIATIRSISPGTSYITVFDGRSGQIIGRPIEAKFFAITGNNPMIENSIDYGQQLATPQEKLQLIPSYLMADITSPFASTDIDGFQVIGIPQSVNTGEAIPSIRIRAIDGEDFRVKGYQGTIRFRSTDDSAILPLETKFLPQNEGERSFDLALTFMTPGNHSLIIEDVADNSIFGRVENIVVQGNSAPPPSAPEISSPTDGVILSASIIKVSGRSPIGALISIYDGTKKHGETVSDNSGRWIFTTPELFDGNHKLSAVATNIDNEVSPISEPITITIDSTEPLPAEITIDPDSTDPRGWVDVTVTVMERELSKVEIIIDRRIVELNSDTEEPQVFTGSFIAPRESGSYDIDIILTDELGNSETFEEVETLRVYSATDNNQPDLPTGDAILPVTNVRIIDRGTSYITLSWDTVNNADRYKVKYGESAADLEYSSIFVNEDTQGTIDGLVNNVEYYFAIVALDRNGNESEITPTSHVSGSPEYTEKYAHDDEIAVIPGDGKIQIISSNLPAPITPIDESTEQTNKKIIRVPLPHQTNDVGPAAIVFIPAIGSLALSLIRRRKR